MCAYVSVTDKVTEKETISLRVGAWEGFKVG